MCDELQKCGQSASSVNKETDEKVNKLVTSDRRLPVYFVTESFGTSTGSIHSIVTETLLMKKVFA